MVRMRSPNFPGIPLDAAVRAVTEIYDKNRRAVIMREDAAKDLGYSGLTGRSLKILGALNQYDLIENVSKGQVRVSQTAEEILHGLPDEVKVEALHRAGNAPPLFQAIFERFEGDIPGENAVRSFLFQKGFTNEGVEKALRNFMETNRHLEIAGAIESHRNEPPSGRELIPVQSKREEESREMGTAAATAESAGGLKVFRGGALDFSLSSSGLSLTGKTNSASELKAFIERLKVLAAVLPDAANDQADDDSE
jgi:hypothetical protein